MNIQVPNIDINKINTELIKSYFVKKNNFDLIFSESNILELRDNTIFKMESKDIPIESHIIGKYEILIDKSKWIKGDELYQVPTKHLFIKTVEEIYKLNKKSLIKLIIQRENDIITNVYFKTDEILDIEMFKKDIISFLSILKLY